MELHPKRKHRWSAEEREQLVANYQASGKTQKSFCTESGMSVASLTNWLRQSRSGSDSDSGQLIEVPLPVANAGSVEVEVTLPGMTVKIPVGTSTAWASELLHALRCGA